MRSQTLEGLGLGFIEVGPFALERDPKKLLSRVERRAGKLVRAALREDGGTRGVRAHKIPLGVHLELPEHITDSAVLDTALVCAQLLRGVCDYLVVSVPLRDPTSPHTIYDAARLGRALAALGRALDDGQRRTPLLMRVSAELAADSLDGVAELALTFGLDGLVVASGERECGADSEPQGRALQCMRRLRRRTRDRVMLIASGGIRSAEDVLDALVAGATLVQVGERFAAGGALWLALLNRALPRLVRAGGYRTVVGAIGAEPVRSDEAMSTKTRLRGDAEARAIADQAPAPSAAGSHTR
jgi:dihydroorotate dehydrogenase